MTNFWSCHLIVNRKLADGHKCVREFINSDLSSLGRYFYSIFEMDSIHKHLFSLSRSFWEDVKQSYR